LRYAILGEGFGRSVGLDLFLNIFMTDPDGCMSDLNMEPFDGTDPFILLRS